MNYLALTIGPIVETLSESKKTKELFAGSYLFSYIMKNILKKLNSNGYNLIVPYHKDIKNIFDQKIEEAKKAKFIKAHK
jgi:CRISPR-associated protein Cmr2